MHAAMHAPEHHGTLLFGVLHKGPSAGERKDAPTDAAAANAAAQALRLNSASSVLALSARRKGAQSNTSMLLPKMMLCIDCP